MDARFATVLQRIDTFSNNVAAELSAVSTRIDALIEKISTSMSQADVDSVVGQLSADADKLEAASAQLEQLAADPNNPTPAPVPSPEVEPPAGAPPSEPAESSNTGPAPVGNPSTNI